MAEDLLRKGDARTFEIARNPMFSRNKVAPGVDGRTLNCATGAAHARFRPDASSTVKL